MPEYNVRQVVSGERKKNVLEEGKENFDATVADIITNVADKSNVITVGKVLWSLKKIRVNDKEISAAVSWNVSKDDSQCIVVSCTYDDAITSFSIFDMEKLCVVCPVHTRNVEVSIRGGIVVHLIPCDLYGKVSSCDIEGLVERRTKRKLASYIIDEIPDKNSPHLNIKKMKE